MLWHGKFKIVKWISQKCCKIARGLNDRVLDETQMRSPNRVTKCSGVGFVEIIDFQKYCLRNSAT